MERFWALLTHQCGSVKVFVFGAIERFWALLIVIGRSMANPQSWRVRVVRVGVRVGIWLPFENPYP